MAKIETKINIGDKFWVINNGKAKSFTLNIIEAKETEFYCSIYYYTKVNNSTGIHAGNNNTDNYECFCEEDCFTKKEELLNSL